MLSVTVARSSLPSHTANTGFSRSCRERSPSVLVSACAASADDVNAVGTLITSTASLASSDNNASMAEA
ncbi:hypothetical protein D3C81_1816980 [compost metagenome]